MGAININMTTRTFLLLTNIPRSPIDEYNNVSLKTILLDVLRSIASISGLHFLSFLEYFSPFEQDGRNI